MSLFYKKFLKPAAAYDIWAGSYDQQSGNLMLDLDEQLFQELLAQTDLANKTVVDIGCGTGRHWHKILEKKPRLLHGYDASQGMLDMLEQKFPRAITQKITGHLLPHIPNGYFDVIISTLTLAHIKDLEGLFTEWDRVLKSRADILITDYHPQALAKGAKRTFQYRNRSVSIKNYVHSMQAIGNLADKMGFKIQTHKEITINSSYKHYYEEKNALTVYEKFKGMPIIYGLHLKKVDDLT